MTIYLADGPSNAEALFESPFDFLTSTVRSGEFNYAYNVSLKHRYLYIENAKSACTTIKASLGIAELIRAGLGSAFAENYAKNVHVNVLGTPFSKPFQLGKTLFDRVATGKEFTTFTFVKNPFSRALSAYLDKVKNKLPDSAGIYKAAGKTFDDELSFPEYLQTLDRIISSGSHIDKHFRPQSFQCGQGKLKIDFVGFVENFDEDFRRITSQIGFSDTEIVLGISHSTKARNLLQDFYGPAELEILKRIYKGDFDMFCYGDDLNNMAPIARRR
jgi:hypothetical protein